MGDGTIVRVVGHGTITFQRESMSPMILRDVLVMLGLKKSLISISMIEDRGLGVSFLDGHVHVLMKTVGPSASYTIGVRCGKLHKLLFHPSMFWHIAAAMSFVICGTRGWLICIIQL